MTSLLKCASIMRTLNATEPVEVIDKSGLDVHLDDAAALKETDWTADSWAALVAARDASTTVNGNKGATQEEVDTATDALNSAIDGLTKA